MCLNTRKKHVTMVMAINGLQCGGVLYLECLVTLRHSVPLDTDITHVINEPGLPPPFLHTSRDQKLDSGKAWDEPRGTVPVSQ